jgi:predicted permease
MNLLQDVRFGARMLLRNPGFTGVVVLALALGIGANTAVFTLVHAVLFRGLPFEQADRILHIGCNNLPKGRDRIGTSYPDFRDWRAQARSFQGLAAFQPFTVNLSDRTSAAERYAGAQVTSNLFSLIGQKPLLGRDFRPEEDQPGAERVAIIGYTIWQNRYGRDPNILGRSVRLNEVATTIIGVMPEGMKFPVREDLWIPLIPTAAQERRENRGIVAFGRLADGVTLAAARAEMDAVAKRLEKEYPRSNEGVGIVVKPYNDEFNGGLIRIVFLALLGAVGFVLLIVCANVANLLLSRSLARAKEMSIRSALGASRWRVVRQLLIESLLLALTGGAAGLLIAVWGVRWFDAAVSNTGKPYWIDFRMDFTVFGYLAGICLATSILFGLVPAIQVSRIDLSESLKEGGRGSSAGRRAGWLSSFLVVGELALALVLLVGAGLMIRSFLKLYGMGAGIDAENILTMRVNLVDAKYPDAAKRAAFYDRLQPRLAAIPGVESATFTTNLPLGGSYGWRVEIEGSPPVEDDTRPSVNGLIVGPDYFRVFGFRVLRGRAFTETDGLPGKEAVIVNQRFAARYWPNEDALGKRLRIVRDGARPWLTVVGVCQDVRQNDPQRADLDPLMYVPYRQDPARVFALVARAQAPSTLAPAVRREVRAIDEDLPAYEVMTLREFFIQRRWPFRVFGMLFSAFALIALALSTVGIYGVMAYSVNQRTQEIGVRIAPGASGGSILALVLRRGLGQLAAGLVLGLAGAYGVTRVLQRVLVQVSATDPLTFASLSALLTVVAVLACWIPARRAMRVDPVVALRYE